ncbi:MAG: geranylgeranyl reductase family protein [Acidobacteriaceae bacterium]
MNTGQAMERWDAIMVGAGPAGCAAAYDLAAAGRSVLLLDRAEFPRHKACAGGLTRKTLRALRYPVDAVTRATPCAIHVEREAGQPTRLESRKPVCAMTVRQELDEYCLRQTLARGAQLARIGAILAIEQDANGVTVRTEDAPYAGRFLVGADGVHSRVRQLVYGADAAWFWRGFALEAQVRPERGCASDVAFAFDAVRGGYGWVFPKRDHLNVGLYTQSATEKLDRGRLLQWIRERIGGAAIEGVTGQYLGFGAETAPAAAGRVFLVGDAGGFADPLTGEGIYGAIVSGQAAAAAIDGDLRGGDAAHRSFAALSTSLREDLQMAASGARWFYGNPDVGFRILTAPLLRRVMIGAFADGTKIAGLARAVRQFAHISSAGA